MDLFRKRWNNLSLRWKSLYPYKQIYIWKIKYKDNGYYVIFDCFKKGECSTRDSWLSNFDLYINNLFHNNLFIFEFVKFVKFKTRNSKTWKWNSKLENETRNFRVREVFWTSQTRKSFSSFRVSSFSSFWCVNFPIV